MTASERIIERLCEAGVSFKANDNISRTCWPGKSMQFRKKLRIMCGRCSNRS